MSTQEAQIRRGLQLPDFGLPVIPEGVVRVSDFRNRQNLIIIFRGNADSARVENLYRDLTHNQSDLEWEDTQVLWIIETLNPEPVEPREFPVLVDEGGKVYRQLFGTQVERKPNYLVLDRFGELYDFGPVYSDGDPVDAQELLDMVRFIELQCPE